MSDELQVPEPEPVRATEHAGPRPSADWAGPAWSSRRSGSAATTWAARTR
ncbi:hypothetical protein [Luteimicrobium album]|nr:hypothetical protein [Luteimicrobium album]